MPIKYKFDILAALKEKGYNTTRIRKENLLSEGVLQSLRENKYISLANISRICELLAASRATFWSIPRRPRASINPTPFRISRPCPLRAARTAQELHLRIYPSKRHPTPKMHSARLGQAREGTSKRMRSQIPKILAHGVSPLIWCLLVFIWCLFSQNSTHFRQTKGNDGAEKALYFRVFPHVAKQRKTPVAALITRRS